VLSLYIECKHNASRILRAVKFILTKYRQKISTIIATSARFRSSSKNQLLLSGPKLCQCSSRRDSIWIHIADWVEALSCAVRNSRCEIRGTRKCVSPRVGRKRDGNRDRDRADVLPTCLTFDRRNWQLSYFAKLRRGHLDGRVQRWLLYGESTFG
jgi:hypothetical protein